MAIPVTFKYEEDPIKIEGARVATMQNNDFSDTQGQLTPQSEVGSMGIFPDAQRQLTLQSEFEPGQNSNSSKILWLLALLS